MQQSTIKHEGPPSIYDRPEKDGLAFLVSQHLRFRSLVQQVLATSDLPTRIELVLTLMREEVAHTSSEERHVHGLYTKYLGEEGRRFYEDSLKDDNAAKATWAMIEGLANGIRNGTFTASSPIPSKFASEETRALGNVLEVWNHYVNKIIQQLTTHMKEEERDWWPRLAAVMTPSDLETLRENLVSAQAAAPTHPHPEGPSGVMGAKIMHPVVAKVDAAMDALKGEGGGSTKTGTGLATGQTK